MREIKFRGWLPEEKGIYPCSSPWMGNVMVLLESGDSLVFKAMLEENVQVMQFTGLKDKNGKEIYEGDILQIISIKDPVEVKWEIGGTCGSSMVAGFSLDDFEFGAEVVGNVWETPELLK